MKFALTGLAGLVVGCGRNSEEISGSSSEGRPSFRHRRSKQKNYTENFLEMNMEMVWIPGGDLEFPAEYGRPSDYVGGFWIGKQRFLFLLGLNL